MFRCSRFSRDGRTSSLRCVVRIERKYKCIKEDYPLVGPGPHRKESGLHAG